MDSWSDKQIQSMRLGGNAKMIEWFKQNGINSRAPISEKYHTDTAELYRLRLAAIRDGKPAPTELPPKQAPAAPGAAPTEQRPMQGFGSQPMPQRPSNDPMDEITKTAAELSKTASQTFSLLAGTFSSLGKEAAEKLKEVKISEKLAQTGESFAKTSEKVGETLKDPELAQKAQLAATQSWQKVSSSALNFWKSVVEPGVMGSNQGSASSAGSGYATMQHDDDDEAFVDAPDHPEEVSPAPVLRSNVNAERKPSPAPVVQAKAPGPPAKKESEELDDADEEWLQKQLSQVSTPPTSQPAPAAPKKKNEDDFFSEFGV
jgi:hypothetical protein